MIYKVLFIEDSEEMQEAVGRALKKECSLTLASSNKAARIHLEQSEFDLVLLDLTLPDGDGFKICNYIRQRDLLRDLPIIFMSGRAEIEDKEMAFSIGADDYIVKPMSSRELRARVLGRLRRAHKIGESFSVGNLKFDLPLQKVTILNGVLERALETTSLEFRILLYFARHEDHIFSRNQLLTAIWGENVHLLERTVDTHISHLRKKLKEAGSGLTIKPIHGSGYKLTTEKNIKKIA